MQTTYKVGDKVRILNAKKIKPNAYEFETGEIATVTCSSESGIVIQRSSDGAEIGVWDSELQYIEKVEESDAKMTKFKVGDRVRIIKDDWGITGVKIGTEAIVTEVDPDGDVRVDVLNQYGVPAFFLAHEVEKLSSKPTKNQRITTLEQKVEVMQAEIDALKAAQKVTVSSPEILVKSEADIAKIAEGFAKMVAKEMKPSPNEQRKAIIDEAKAFVEKYTPIVRIDDTPLTSEHGDVKITLNVNSKKRTVACIVHYLHVKDAPIKRGIAKCAPDDVFNADIGKAIALGRALGLDVSKFEKAVQPTELVVGHVVTKVNGPVGLGRIDNVEKSKAYIGTDGGHWCTVIAESSTLLEIDDTEAQY